MPHGLARLVVLEQLFQDRSYYLHIQYPRKSLRVLTSEMEVLGIAEPGDDNNYDYTYFEIPYALLWDAKRVRRFAERVVSFPGLSPHRLLSIHSGKGVKL